MERNNTKVDAVIFDLDNTLANTTALKEIRDNRNFEQINDENLSKVFLYPKTESVLDGLKEKEIPIALVTNSPKKYAEKIIKHLDIDVFDAYVYYDDVAPDGAKPEPDGIKLAVEKLGLGPESSVIYIGDERIDFEASYAAEVKPVMISWGSKAPISIMPASILSSESLLDDLDDFEHINLIADRCAENKNFSFHKKQLYFAPLDVDGNIIAEDRDKIQTVCLGRYFSQGSEITANLHDKHPLSVEIYKKETNKGSYCLPSYLVDLSIHAVNKISEYFYGNRNGFDIVTVIPAKRGGNKRLENMLKRMARESELKADFIGDLFEFSVGSKSLKTLGGAHARYEELLDNYDIKAKYKRNDFLKDKKIIVIDDVITTGSTLKRSFELLEQCGVSRSLGLSFAKTVSINKGSKECEKCGRRMRIRKGKYGRFWSCVGYFDDQDQCKHTENILEIVKTCPKCGGGLSKRRNRRDNSEFLGCENYSNKEKPCDHTEGIS
ncbi:HAD-IA family hydrolase [Neptuniibacter sp. QD48_11]|uniref:HAD-IA family hydrolase n=1 Tax=Neptuniibacter sp. QD48_11 TaxID=3398211 RepID=UPI0039F61390